ncbi:unnamed protein product, partial [Closterium sp. Yama58-4]
AVLTRPSHPSYQMHPYLWRSCARGSLPAPPGQGPRCRVPWPFLTTIVPRHDNATHHRRCTTARGAIAGNVMIASQLSPHLSQVPQGYQARLDWGPPCLQRSRDCRNYLV